MQPVAQVSLCFSDWRPVRHLNDPLEKDLSAVTRVGRSLFLACDETASVERLERLEDGTFANHRHYPLGDFVDLPAGPGGEMDIEGLCATEEYLWIVGSHALKRDKPKRDENAPGEALERMRDIEREPNRYFLGRLPLAQPEPGLFEPARSAGERRASWLKFGKRRSKLLSWLRDDPHLAPFLDIPSKENGLDIEGIATCGNRVWLGTRGPVLRGHAIVLDLDLKERASGRLKARRVDGRRRYRKHLLNTQGLGIRDMCLDGDDLLLLVGPTMSLEGPAFVLRWLDAVHDNESGVVEDARLRTLAELPYKLNVDHPEGLELWPEPSAGALLVIYDAPGPDRVDSDRFTVRGDVIQPAA